MAAEYQDTDWQVVDYPAVLPRPGIHGSVAGHPALRIRGPRPARLAKGEYFVLTGAAQTFGRFCDRPFPTLLSERLSLPVLNISHGGAGPSFFCYDNDRLLPYLNNARFIVLQVMSGRSEGNSLFESRGVGHYTPTFRWESVHRMRARRLRRAHPHKVSAEGSPSWCARRRRANWLASYRALLAKITAPTVLFWFSTRKPDHRNRSEGVRGLFGDYPQLVNGAMLKALRAECDYFASCVSRRGLPQTLVDRESGEPVIISDPWTSAPWEKNWYYPSPEMHEDAAQALERPCRKAAGLAPARRGWWRP